MDSATMTMKARIVRVKIEEGKTGLFYATSPDLKGLIVSAPTLDGLEAKVPEAITEMYAASGQDVAVTRVDESHEESMRSWVAVPILVARERTSARA